MTDQITAMSGLSLNCLHMSTTFVIPQRSLRDIVFASSVRSHFSLVQNHISPGSVAQSVTCLATDANLTADPGVASSIPARSHSLVKIDHEIFSTVILHPSAESFKKGCCQLQAKVCARSTG